jgi:hypothetical protein
MTPINVENHELRRRLLNHWSIGEGEDDICVIYSRLQIQMDFYQKGCRALPSSFLSCLSNSLSNDF